MGRETRMACVRAFAVHYATRKNRRESRGFIENDTGTFQSPEVENTPPRAPGLRSL